VVDLLYDAVAEHTADVLLVRLGAREHELDFFLPVDEGADGGDGHDCDQNSEALNPGYKSYNLFSKKERVLWE